MSVNGVSMPRCNWIKDPSLHRFKDETSLFNEREERASGQKCMKESRKGSSLTRVKVKSSRRSRPADEEAGRRP